MPALPVSDDLKYDRKNRFLPLVDATHQDFPVGENFHIAKVSIAELRKLFTYLLTDAQPPKTG